MSSPAPLNLRIGSALRVWLKQELARSGLKAPVLGLTFGKWTHQKSENWSLGFFEREQIKVIEKDTLAHGHPAHWIADGIELCFYQFHLLSELEGKTLDLGPQGPVLK